MTVTLVFMHLCKRIYSQRLLRTIFKETVVVSGAVATVKNSAVEMSPNSAKYLVTGLTTGTYSILVFDVESDGSFNPSQRPAFSAVVNVTSKLTSTELLVHKLSKHYPHLRLYLDCISTSNFCCRYTCEPQSEATAQEVNIFALYKLRSLYIHVDIMLCHSFVGIGIGVIVGVSGIYILVIIIVFCIAILMF